VSTAAEQSISAAQQRASTATQCVSAVKRSEAEQKPNDEGRRGNGNAGGAPAWQLARSIDLQRAERCAAERSCAAWQSAMAPQDFRTIS
jgi:hypothetical protein